LLNRIAGTKRLAVARKVVVDPATRHKGADWPVTAESMIGFERMANVRDCVEGVIQSGVEGDLVEAGVWRGGAAIFMRGILAAWGDRHRRVWACDSFEGLPKPTGRFQYAPDSADDLWKQPSLAVRLDEVRSNFARYGLLDDRVVFLPGWFSDTLPDAPIDKVAVLRADGDLYESTMDILTSLYPKVSRGGYVIIDDYGGIEQCRAAVEEYRRKEHIDDEIVPIDLTGVYWQKR
jgi:O-methyltransferase